MTKNKIVILAFLDIFSLCNPPSGLIVLYLGALILYKINKKTPKLDMKKKKKNWYAVHTCGKPLLKRRGSANKVVMLCLIKIQLVSQRVEILPR